MITAEPIKFSIFGKVLTGSGMVLGYLVMGWFNAIFFFSHSLWFQSPLIQRVQPLVYNKEMRGGQSGLLAILVILSLDISTYT